MENKKMISEINNFFDKVFLINLDSRNDRLNECNIELQKRNIKFKRISANNGKVTYKPGVNLSVGNHGLLLTNINIIEQAINENLGNILILEDDIMFVNGINKIFADKIKYLPDNWDIIHLGGSHLFNKGKFDVISNSIDFKINKDNYKKLNYELCTTTWTQTTHAVAINTKFFELLLHKMKTSKKPIDIIYCQLQQQEEYKTYTFLPSLALQRASFSDIENVYVDYNKNKRWAF